MRSTSNIKNTFSLNSKITFDTNSSIQKKIEKTDKSLLLLQSLNERTKKLKSLKSFLIKHKSNLIKYIHLEVHKTIEESSGEFDYALEFIQYSLSLISTYKFEKKIDSNKKLFFKPTGAVLAITPYNDPLAGITRKIAPSIASGSPLIIKTSSNCINLCKYLDDNLPKDLKNYIQFIFIKDKSLMDKAVQNEKIKTITFTGSTSVGLKLDNIQTEHLQKKILELGGINYAVIFDNYKLDNVIDDILIRKIKAAGQACSSINKVFVNESIKKEFEKILISKVMKLSCGDVSFKNQPNFGPVISKNHYKFLKKLETNSLRKGKLITRSNNLDNTDNLYPLTVVDVSINDSVFDNYETFGPLLGISYFKNNDVILKKLSKCNYSLVTYIFTKNKSLHKKVQSLNFGSIGVNTTKIQSPGRPTGGNNLSGIGREGGIWGFEEFLTTVNYVGG